MVGEELTTENRLSRLENAVFGPEVENAVSGPEFFDMRDFSEDFLNPGRITQPGRTAVSATVRVVKPPSEGSSPPRKGTLPSSISVAPAGVK